MAPETKETPAPAPKAKEPIVNVPGTFDPFQVMDRLDEEALVAEMEGRAFDKLVYVVKQDGQEVVGLSKEGVDECCMALVSQGQVIREEDVEYTMLGEGEAREALFKVKAARYAVNGTGDEAKLDQVIGVKRQPLYYEPMQLSLDSKVPGNKWKHLTFAQALENDEARDYLDWLAERSSFELAVKEFARALLHGTEVGDIKPGRRMNPHWYEHGAMKAARNARFRMIPAAVRASVIASARAAGKVREVEANTAQGKGKQQGKKQQQENGRGSTGPTTEAGKLSEAMNTKLPGKEGKWGGYAGKPLGEVPTEILEAVDSWATDKGLQASEDADDTSLTPKERDDAVTTARRMHALTERVAFIVIRRQSGELPEPPHKDGTPREPSAGDNAGGASA